MNINIQILIFFILYQIQLYESVITQTTAEEDLVTQIEGWPSIDFNMYSGQIIRREDLIVCLGNLLPIYEEQIVDGETQEVQIGEECDESLTNTGGLITGHYVFIEAESNKENSPLIIMFPDSYDCSCMTTLFLDNGPIIMNQASGNFEINQYSWHKFANLLYIDLIPSVGFSKYNPPTEDNTMDPFNFVYNLIGDHNFTGLFLTIKEKFEHILDFSQLEIWLESTFFGGLISPIFKNRIYSYNSQQPSDKQFYLKGFIFNSSVLHSKDYDVKAQLLVTKLIQINLIDINQQILWQNGCITTESPTADADCQQFITYIKEILNNLNLNNYEAYSYDYEDNQKQINLDQISDSGNGNARNANGVYQEYLDLINKFIHKNNIQDNSTTLTPRQRLQSFLNSSQVKQDLHITYDQQWNQCIQGLETLYHTSTFPHTSSHYLQQVDILFLNGQNNIKVSQQYTENRLNVFLQDYTTSTHTISIDNEILTNTEDQQLIGTYSLWENSSGAKIYKIIQKNTGLKPMQSDPTNTYYIIKNVVLGNGF